MVICAPLLGSSFLSVQLAESPWAGSPAPAFLITICFPTSGCDLTSLFWFLILGATTQLSM